MVNAINEVAPFVSTWSRNKKSQKVLKHETHRCDFRFDRYIRNSWTRDNLQSRMGHGYAISSISYILFFCLFFPPPHSPRIRYDSIISIVNVGDSTCTVSLVRCDEYHTKEKQYSCFRIHTKWSSFRARTSRRAKYTKKHRKLLVRRTPNT